MSAEKTEMTSGTVEHPPSKHRIRFIAAIAVIAIVVGIVGYFLFGSASDPRAEAEREARELIARVSELMVLPDDEEPVVATVADPAQLQDTPFFANAKIGDRVLIYNNARKAILYDPEAHRILEVAPLNIGEPEEQ